jgi:biopolymer transport protein ExbD
MNRPEINVTPLIDVLLVLLIIFMVVTPTKPNKFDARIPPEKTDSKDVRVDPRTIVVAFSNDAKIRINREITDATFGDTTALTSRLKDVFDQREANSEPERTVFIKAPKNLNYGNVTVLIDAVKASGARPISLEIDDLDG